jgi:hypothetical protein
VQGTRRSVENPTPNHRNALSIAASNKMGARVAVAICSQ